MHRAKVSILMPVKNTARFLNQCLDSILNQSLKEWELIAVDDNSEDDSFAILNAYTEKDTRISIFRNNKKGIITALQLAYQQSTAQFITRMDSDDIMEPDKLELLLKKLQFKGDGHLAIGLVNYFSDAKLGEGYANYANWLNKLTVNAANFNDIYKECTIPSPCWMVNRLNFEACGGFNSEIYPEDYDLAFRFRKAGLQIVPVNKVLHQWRDYDSRTSRTDKNYSDNRFSELKVMHFLEQDINSTQPLILWGAGAKGKKIASILTDAEVEFYWVCNNENKIGKDIYGTILQNLEPLSVATKAQVIVAVSSPHDSGGVEQLIKGNPQHQYFRFF